MKTNQEQALDIIRGMQYDFLCTLRADMYKAIDETREHARVENEEIRVELQNEIKSIGKALEDSRARGLAPGDVIYDELVAQIQKVNHARAHNRQTIKTLAEEQRIQKCILAELNREISYLEEDLNAVEPEWEVDPTGYSYAVYH